MGLSYNIAAVSNILVAMITLHVDQVPVNLGVYVFTSHAAT